MQALNLRLVFRVAGAWEQDKPRFDSSPEAIAKREDGKKQALEALKRQLEPLIEASNGALFMRDTHAPDDIAPYRDDWDVVTRLVAGPDEVGEKSGLLFRFPQYTDGSDIQIEREYNPHGRGGRIAYHGPLEDVYTATRIEKEIGQFLRHELKADQVQDMQESLGVPAQ